MSASRADETARRLLDEVLAEGSADDIAARRGWRMLGMAAASAYAAMIGEGMPEPVARELARDVLICKMR